MADIAIFSNCSPADYVQEKYRKFEFQFDRTRNEEIVKN